MKKILQGIAFACVGLTVYFLYTSNWVVDENTEGLLLLSNVAAFTPYFFYRSIERIRIGSGSISTILYGVIVSYVYTAFLFGLAYTLISKHYGRHIGVHGTPADMPFNQSLEGIDGVYFSFTTLATVGFGDITPTYTLTKGLVILEILVGLIYQLVLFALVSQYVTRTVHEGS